jgi:hypothetical protein
MNDQDWDGLEPARSRLRVLVARVDAQLVLLEKSQPGEPPQGEMQQLTQSWNDLVAALALGAEPALRSCPHCRRQVLREATRCRYCMRQSAAA